MLERLSQRGLFVALGEANQAHAENARPCLADDCRSSLPHPLLPFSPVRTGIITGTGTRLRQHAMCHSAGGGPTDCIVALSGSPCGRKPRSAGLPGTWCRGRRLVVRNCAALCVAGARGTCSNLAEQSQISLLNHNFSVQRRLSSGLSQTGGGLIGECTRPFLTEV